MRKLFALGLLALTSCAPTEQDLWVPISATDPPLAAAPAPPSPSVRPTPVAPPAPVVVAAPVIVTTAPVVLAPETGGLIGAAAGAATNTPTRRPAATAPDWAEAAPDLIAPPVIAAEDFLLEADQGLDVAAGEPEMMIEIPFAENETHRDVVIYYGTNRAPSDRPDRNDPTSIYTDDLGNLTYGTATVSIPREHQIGNLEAPGFFEAFLFGEDIEKHVILQSMDALDLAAFQSAIGADLAQENDILVYVHGFNTSMEKASRRMAQMRYDLVWPGPAVLFSWPSMGSALSYRHDSEAAGASRSALQQMLGELAGQPDADRIVVIAHSMGTRVLSSALDKMIDQNDPALDKIDTIILAAPDISQPVFLTELAPQFAKLDPPRVTLYASSNDSALALSKSLNGSFPRIGDFNENMVAMKGINLIDASDVKSDFFDHTYFGDNETILTDVHALIHQTPDPFQRPFLSPRPPDATPPNHFKIVPGLAPQ